MRVFVAGAAGAIGMRLVPQLLARGHQVTATTRSEDKARRLRAFGADTVALDGLDAAAVTQAVARAEPDAIVHQMTALAGKSDMKHFDRWFAVTNELRTIGTEHLLAAAEAVGVGRFVVQSYTGWTNARTGRAIKTEDDALEPDPPKQQVRSLAAIRFLERAVTTAPLHGIVLRYGAFYGPGASEELVAMVRARRLPILGDGGGVWSWVHVDDAAAATVAALERAPAGVLNVVDDEPAPVAEWLPYLARVAGAKPPRRVPRSLGRLAVGEVGVRWMTSSRGSSNAKAKRELGWRLIYPSWREGFAHGLDVPPHETGATPNPLERRR
jgi:nucleoside-diphosphate-sugar epimerase